METILCPLTSIDVSGVERIVLTLGSLLSTPADPVKIEQALSRVTLQWRLLAGRVEWDPAVGYTSSHSFFSIILLPLSVLQQ